MLLRNSIWNLTGLALPTLVALATVPILIHYLGLEGFGVITLIGSVVGYFGVLDLNLTAGSIKYLAQFHAQQEEVKFSETFWFGFIFYSALISSVTCCSRKVRSCLTKRGVMTLIGGVTTPPSCSCNSMLGALLNCMPGAMAVQPDNKLIHPQAKLLAIHKRSVLCSRIHDLLVC